MKLQFVEAGEIVTTHGVRGEVKVLPWLDCPDMLCEFDRCRLDGKEMIIDQCRVQKTCNLLKLRGIDTMEDAQKLRGKIIELYREDIDDEVIFAAELVGMDRSCNLYSDNHRRAYTRHPHSSAQHRHSVWHAQRIGELNIGHIRNHRYTNSLTELICG